MNMIYIQLLGLIPAMLILWIGNRMRASTPDEQGLPNWFTFLLISLLVLLNILLFVNPDINQVISIIWQTSLPVSSGVLAITLYQIFSDHKFWSKDSLKTLFLFLSTIAFLIFVGIGILDVLSPLLFALAGIFSAFVWWSWRRIGENYLVVGAIQLLLLGISTWSADANHQLFNSPRWLSVMVQLTFFFIPAISIAVVAHLVFDLTSGVIAKEKSKILFGAILVLLTVVFLGYQMYLTSIWDVATDGLGVPFLEMLIGTASLSAAMIMVWFLRGWRKLAGLAFSLFVPLSMLYPSWFGAYGPNGEWGVLPANITEQRAETITIAIQGYYETEEEYPSYLKNLFPRNLVYIPRPIMIPRQTWCYEGGKNYYRFGYVHREFFSSSASVRIHSSAGEPPVEYWSCEREAAKYLGLGGYPNP